MKLVGVIMAYNDQDCIGNAIECLLKEHDDEMVFDHGSTDDTAKVIQSLPCHYEYVSRTLFPNFNVPGNNNIHYKVTTWIRDSIPHYDWVSWIDADEILESTNPDKTLKQEIIDAHNSGYKGIQSILRNYWITEEDDYTEADYLKRIKRYEDSPPHSGGGINRSWNINITPIMTEATLRHTFFRNHSISPNPTLLRHYAIRTPEQGWKKIQVDRQRHLGAGAHYASYDNGVAEDLIISKDWGTKDD